MVQAQHGIALADFPPAFQMHHLRRQSHKLRVLGNHKRLIAQ
jgi:hypothetical protein